MLAKHFLSYIAFIGLSFCLISCSSEKNTNLVEQSAAAEASPQEAQIRKDLWPKSKTVIASDEARIQAILEKMSIADKVGQVVMGEIRDITPSDVSRYKLGGVLNGGGAFPNNNKQASAAEWVELADAFYQASIERDDDGPGIPILWGTDAVHGNSNVYGATLFPHNIGLGATRNASLMRQLGEVTAKEVNATGLYWTFAPTVAVPQDDRWGRTYEGFSEDPAIVAKLSAAMIEGLQGSLNKNYLDSSHILATAKHFIGDGGTLNGIDQGDARISESELSKLHGPGYFAALDMGIQTVMSSFNSWNGEKIHGDHYLLTEVLKNTMGFDGFVIGDWNGHGQVPGCTNKSCAQAINAGVDMIMVPKDWEAVYKNTLSQVKSGEISTERLNDAVKRILRVKLRMGMFDDKGPKSREGAGDQSFIGHPEHRAIARQAVRESLVLLKNNAQTLPLKANQNILLAGTAANELYNQLGGWSMTWLGTETVLEDFPGATRIADAIQQVVEESGGVFSFDTNGKYTNKPDVAIMVIAEPPYAEGPGDRPNLAFSPDNREHLDVMQKLQADGIPVVTIFLSGRPMWINAELNASDAFVAAWLPGTEGQGVSDVLFCTPVKFTECGFTGKLAFSWPKLPDQGPLNKNDPDYDPLFAFGYGLQYGESTELGRLSEDSNMAAASAIGATLFRGYALPPYKVALKEHDHAAIPVTSSTSQTSNAGVEAQVFDWKTQEDAQRIKFSGSGLHSWKLQSDKMISWLQESENGALLAMDIRVLNSSAQPFYAAIECPAGCVGKVDISSQLRSDEFSEWQSFAIPLQCFAQQSASLGRISNPLVLQTEGKWTVELSTVRIVSSTQEMLRRFECTQHE